MHHFIYPSKDTYISNRSGLADKNFGVTEILSVGTSNTALEVRSLTTDYIYTSQSFDHQQIDSFTGYFSGSYSGSYSGSVGGITTGSYDDSIVNFVGCLTGTGSGVDSRNQPHWTTVDTQFVDRTLLKFDVNAISASLISGDIGTPQFFLKLKICNEYDLPINYTIFALPVSQSWNMGNGYLSDGGSSTGASWQYRDNNNGTEWYNPQINPVPRLSVDFITNPSLATASFGYGGGTWYSNIVCSQGFNYQTADINMDVTSIVLAWISGSISNEGILLISSDELEATGSGFTLTFYSRDTNTIYSPYLDVAWSDVLQNGYVTGSNSTGSVIISTIAAGISASVQSGSSFTIAGGVSGSFSSSAIIYTTLNYITASNQIFDYAAPSNSNDNAVWYANNGYHYDSWWTAWDLDPYHGGFLPNTDIQIAPVPPSYGSAPLINFTGSFTGSFSGSVESNGSVIGLTILTASYFSGSVDGIDQEGNDVGVSGSIDGIVSGSVTSDTFILGYQGALVAPLVFLNGTGSGNYLDPAFYSFSGFTSGTGLTGNIIGDPIFGNVNGFVTVSQSLLTGSCGNFFSASFAKAIFTSGIFSGSTFTALYIDHKFENALLSGSWNDSALLGSKVNIPLPSAIDPYAYAYVTGLYIHGTALGTYTISGSNDTYGGAGSNSASFQGQFIDGDLLGGILSLQLSGSVFTSSFAYTSSIELSSSVFNALDANRPFTIILQNMQPTYKAGDIIKIGVFGRKQFPLKYFGMSTQQEQYLMPEYLPTSSYYALKDNETDEIVMNFDEFTKIGCNYPGGNYFMIDTTGLPQDRYYRVLVRVDTGTAIYTVDSGKTFKLTR
jgi:hypothetical protein